MLGVTRVLGEHEWGVVFRLGKPLDAPCGPGRVWMIPGIDQLAVVDRRPTTIDVTALDVVTGNGLPVSATARVHAQVVDPILAVTRVVDWMEAIAMLAETALRAAVQDRSRDEALQERATLESTVRESVRGRPRTGARACRRSRFT